MFGTDAVTDGSTDASVGQNIGIGTKTNMLVFVPMPMFTGLRWLVEYDLSDLTTANQVFTYYYWENPGKEILR